jgi:hypothetical protein
MPILRRKVVRPPPQLERTTTPPQILGELPEPPERLCWHSVTGSDNLICQRATESPSGLCIEHLERLRDESSVDLNPFKADS